MHHCDINGHRPSDFFPAPEWQGFPANVRTTGLSKVQVRRASIGFDGRGHLVEGGLGWRGLLRCGLRGLWAHGRRRSHESARLWSCELVDSRRM
eukprot:1395134-Amorphochlora_amoeboformis.AAC.1